MAAHACTIIHVGADSATESTSTLRMQSWLVVNSSEIALRSSGILLFAGIMSTANSGLPLWGCTFAESRAQKLSR